MFYEDHAPPHFHAIYGSDELLIGISPIEIFEGRSTNRVRSMVLEWTALHQQELLEDLASMPECPGTASYRTTRLRTHMLNIIQAVRVTGPHSLEVIYRDGEVRDVDFEAVIAKGGVFSSLEDPDFFARVGVSEDGRYITWPGDLDFCADAIRASHHAPART